MLAHRWPIGSAPKGKRGVESGTESAHQTDLPPWLPAAAPREPWNVWRTRGDDLEGMREWIRKQTATAPAWPPTNDG